MNKNQLIRSSAAACLWTVLWRVQCVTHLYRSVFLEVKNQPEVRSPWNNCTHRSQRPSHGIAVTLKQGAHNRNERTKVRGTLPSSVKKTEGMENSLPETVAFILHIVFSFMSVWPFVFLN